MLTMTRRAAVNPPRTDPPEPLRCRPRHDRQGARTRRAHAHPVLTQGGVAMLEGRVSQHRSRGVRLTARAEPIDPGVTVTSSSGRGLPNPMMTPAASSSWTRLTSGSAAAPGRSAVHRGLHQPSHPAPGSRRSRSAAATGRRRPHAHASPWAWGSRRSCTITAVGGPTFAPRTGSAGRAGRPRRRRRRTRRTATPDRPLPRWVPVKAAPIPFRSLIL